MSAMSSGPSTSTAGGAVVPRDEGPVKRITYPVTSKAQDILNTLNGHRKDGTFCDIQLKVSESKTVFAHKAILAQSSPFFEGMFLGAFIEATSDVVDVSHLADSTDVIENVINSFYGQSFEVNDTNVYEIINIANMLFLDDMKFQCTRVLEGVISIHNITAMLTMAINFDMRALTAKLRPIIESRFHDHIMFQEDITELNNLGFEQLLPIIKSEYISRKADYIKFILKWFMKSESDDRAKLLIKAVRMIKFRMNRRSFVDCNETIEEVLNEIDSVNFDVNDQLKSEVRQTFSGLIPSEYMKNGTPPPAQSSDMQDEDLDDSELEDEPVKVRNEFDYVWPVYGPRTRKEGYSLEEQEMYNQHHEEMVEREQHRIWAAKYPMELTRRDPDPERPKKIKRQPHPKPHKTRNFRVKPEIEIKEEARLIRSLVVLAPTSVGGVISNDTVDITAFIPRKRGWYKIGTLNLNSLTRAFPNPNRTTGSRPRPGASGRRRDKEDRDRYPFDDGDELPDSDDDEEEFIRMSMMMGRHDIPEMMMMMRHAPSSRRHRLLEEAARGRMPSFMMRKMMGMGMDEDLPHMHLREMMRMAPHMLDPRRQNGRDNSVPSLRDDNKWKMLYFRHKLYFTHDQVCASVFCYDIDNRNWSRSNMSLDVANPESTHRLKEEIADGIELALMGRTVYAAVRIVIMDNEREYRHGRYDEEEEDPTRSCNVLHKLYKMSGEGSGASWTYVMSTSSHYTSIPKDKIKKKDDKDKLDRDRRREYEMMAMMARIPQPLRPGCFKTTLYVENDETLYILTSHKSEKNDEKVARFRMNTCDVVYLDLKECFDGHAQSYNNYVGKLTPVESDGLVYMLNDWLEHNIRIDLDIPIDQYGDRMKDNGRGCQGEVSDFDEALKRYPRVPCLAVGDGKSMWVLDGQDNNTSSLLEVTVNAFRLVGQHEKEFTQHTPPPYRAFTIACGAGIDKAIVRTLTPSLKYQHGE
ncbi:uncharacterized protein LOC128232579 [Mya arenaria]|uniref:uncharacterized protein LOC128232579 n=1 Tax=Mya arenaria TaxID=6604 RepID=UPI0022E402AC|nr:uncharacterized protein LOC128232579 [Mya arenaria]XP_052802185.1 uncharacterized protein LOC128232579 [Mya arenaria]